LQHDDGHSLVLASTYPNLWAYDPAFAYEMAIIIDDGIKSMYGPEPQDRFYYLTLYNENYQMPALPEGEEGERVRQGVLRGLYRYAPAPLPDGARPDEASATGARAKVRDARAKGREAKHDGGRLTATLLFSGTAWQAVMAARDILDREWGVAAEAWSVTSYKALREEALSVERRNRLHPTEPAGTPWIAEQLADCPGPVVAVTDFMKAVPDQVARWVPGGLIPLGTDGFGRSDTREALRRHFEVDAHHVVVAVLAGLAQRGEIKAEIVAEAIKRYGIDADSPDPRTA
ncbi:MAG: transketolase-like TK C-terminal-containing protein, partial [Acidimicrobiales bacterium]